MIKKKASKNCLQLNSKKLIKIDKSASQQTKVTLTTKEEDIISRIKIRIIQKEGLIVIITMRKETSNLTEPLIMEIDLTLNKIKRRSIMRKETTKPITMPMEMINLFNIQKMRDKTKETIKEKDQRNKMRFG